MPIDRLQAFYKTHYQPDNAVLLVAGRFEEQRALDLVAQYFGVIPKPARGPQKLYTAEPTQDGERSVTVRRVGDVQWAISAYHVPAGSRSRSSRPSTCVTLVLGDTPSGRLHKALVESKRASQIFGGNFQFHDPGLAYFAAQVRTDASLDNARDGLIQTVEQIAATPPTAEEVERARTTLLTQIELGLNSAERVGLQISEWIGMGDWRLLFLHRDRLRAATAEDVRKVAAKYFKPSNRTMGLFIPTAQPDRAEIAPTPDVVVDAEGLQGQRRGGRGRGVRSLHRQRRVANQPLAAAGQPQAVAAAEEDARRHRGGQPDAAVRRRDVAQGPARPRRRWPAAC